jgi:hypothetical protein
VLRAIRKNGVAKQQILDRATPDQAYFTPLPLEAAAPVRLG